ncbi:hypothetical protein ISCGN_022547 [Ixodes scapularis]
MEQGKVEPSLHFSLFCRLQGKGRKRDLSSPLSRKTTHEHTKQTSFPCALPWQPWPCHILGTDILGFCGDAIEKKRAGCVDPWSPTMFPARRQQLVAEPSKTATLS